MRKNLYIWPQGLAFTSPTPHVFLTLKSEVRIKTINTIKVEPKRLVHHKRSDTRKLTLFLLFCSFRSHAPPWLPKEPPGKLFKVANFKPCPKPITGRGNPGDSNMQPGLRAPGSQLTINIVLFYEQWRYEKPSQKNHSEEKGLIQFLTLQG